ncbi:MAG TPA: hypothetical protein VFK90_09160 [Anaeromyxobacter sp.]|nr:hypothetical protein [Anaeromyxobacter sp.]
MFQFVRKVTPKNGAAVPGALAFAAEVTGYLNKAYGIDIKFGIQLFGPPQLFWQFETDSIDKMTMLNAKLMQDRAYLALLQQAKDLWLDGSLEDAVVSFQS